MSRLSITPGPHSVKVVPCVKCGSEDISLVRGTRKATEKMGGGKCNGCNASAIDFLPGVATMANMADVWNASNDVEILIAAEEQKIAVAQARIEELREKAGPVLQVLDQEELDECLMTAQEFIEDEKRGMLTADDGTGYWATATHRSTKTTYCDRPEWATHVVWYNR